MENAINHIKGTGRERVYNFIVEFIKKNGYAPSVRDICVGTDLKFTSSVYCHLITLKMLGKIEMKENTPRTIRLVGFELVAKREVDTI